MDGKYWLVTALLAVFLSGCVSKEVRIAHKENDRFVKGIIGKYGSSCMVEGYQAFPRATLDVTAGVGGESRYDCRATSSSSVSCKESSSSANFLLQQAQITANRGQRFIDLNEEARNQFVAECIRSKMTDDEVGEGQQLQKQLEEAREAN